jgi:hypothetical protein
MCCVFAHAHSMSAPPYPHCDASCTQGTSGLTLLTSGARMALLTDLFPAFDIGVTDLSIHIRLSDKSRHKMVSIVRNNIGPLSVFSYFGSSGLFLNAIPVTGRGGPLVFPVRYERHLHIK